MSESVRVLVVDDDGITRSALCEYVRFEPGLVVVGEAADGERAAHMAATLLPDVVLLDIHMPTLSGVEATPRILLASPSTRILALSSFASTRSVGQVLRAGASGYVLKDSAPDEITRAIKRVHAGETVLSEGALGPVVAALRGDTSPAASAPRGLELTERELDVVGSMSRGRTNREIAKALGVSESTIKTHLQRVMRKWDVQDRTQVVVRAIRFGFVDLRDYDT